MPPEDIAIRAPTPDDLQAVVDLINACSVAQGGVPDFTPQRLIESWSDLALALDAWVAVAPDGRVVGYEEVQLPGDAAPAEIDGYVHPDFAGRGIGTCLLRLAEARARQVQAPARLRATIESANQAAQQLFKAEGYRPIRHFWRMQIALDAPPPPPEWPAGVAVRTFAHGQDEHRTHAVVEEAFADHWGHTPTPFEEWRRALEQRADFDPALWFLAQAGQQTAGVALCFDRGENGGWIRNLSVHPGWRRRGLGLALLRHAFGALYARGRHTVGLAVDSQSLTGATRLYERAGMQVIERYDICEKAVAP